MVLRLFLAISLVLLSGFQFHHALMQLMMHHHQFPQFGMEGEPRQEFDSTRRSTSIARKSSPKPVPSSCHDTTVPSLHDSTVQLSPCLQRPWLADNISRQHDKDKQLPKFKILLTSYGWNHPDAQRGLASPRSKRQRELLQAIVDHPLFDPHGWEDYTSGRKALDPNVHYYVFLDVETCHEANYPHYGKPDLNHDTEGGRVKEPQRWDKKECYDIDQCPYVDQVLATPVFQAPSSSKSTLVYLECKGNGPLEEFRKEQPSRQIAMVSLSAHESQILPSMDQGLPPPQAVVSDQTISLTAQELERIQTCASENDRPYLLSFVGALRKGSPRQKLIELRNETLGVVAMSRAELRQRQQQQQPQQQKAEQQTTPDSIQTHPSRPLLRSNLASTTTTTTSTPSTTTTTTTTTTTSAAYASLLKQSQFAAAPRGTNLFSYRFTEALAAGAIPVVHSDGWVLPFRRELVDWSQCAIIIPEQQIQDTVQILQDISLEQRCRMRQQCQEIYQRYMATPQGTIEGILQGLELVV